jgi:hypothetical protein
VTATFKAGSVLRGLKDFQQATVHHAFDRLFIAPDSTSRFLVADEVGLGKTMVARGVVALAIEHLQRLEVGRIDVVYICSNTEIAAQNVRKLDVVGTATPNASRLTLLANEVSGMRERDLNIVALTPGTSFEQGSFTGRAEERHLLYWLLREAWGFGNEAGPKNVLQATTRTAKTFRDALRWFDRAGIDRGIAGEFASALERRSADDRAHGHSAIRERFERLCEEFAYSRTNIPADQRARRNSLISELRGLLAASCVEALEPDLVILDEFQRFKHLLEDDPDNEASSLARALFNWERPETGERARVLMLSATPYRPLTIAGDGGDDDHHEDFLATVRFLADDDDRADELRRQLREYQRELYGAAPESSRRLHEIGRYIESLLTRYISRTERIGAAGQHDAMLRHVVRAAAPTGDDLRQYLLAQDVAEELDQHDVTELWKSAPYLLNFLDGYQLRSRFDAACAVPSRAMTLARLFDTPHDLLLGRQDLSAYRDVDPGSPRLRMLAQEMIDTEAWRLLWIPPSMPYHRLGGAYAKPELGGFTKRLVFSAWRAVPRAVAGLLSYLAERRLTLEADPTAVNTPQRRAAQRNRLAFTIGANDRRTGMPALALLYPSPALAEAADPRVFAASGADRTIEELLDWACARIAPLLDALPPGASGGDVDERWYWAAPLMLDAGVSDHWWSRSDLAGEWSDHDARASAEGSRWPEHVDLARDVARAAVELGPRPDDLTDVVARLALGAPGTLALRALHRITSLGVGSMELRLPAARIAWALRGLFNSPEATALLRASRIEAFWREVLRHSIDGGLQAVLDEHAHVLVEAEGLQDKSDAETADVVASAMTRALGLRASRVTYSSIEVDGGRISATTDRLHTAFAMRFGDEEGGDRVAGDKPARSSQLREAFNSPYWPFVLVSTAVGQEGLDFHPYCHVVVHWNLPNNPVDLEQREGRVHRFKGHAVRKNVAIRHGAGALAADGDAWATAFALAAEDRGPDDSELVPYWIYPLEHGAAVERHILALPLSRELDRLDVLRNALAIYRLAFGQARQEDVIDHLLSRLGPERAKRLASELRIDLRPPNGARGGRVVECTPERTA